MSGTIVPISLTNIAAGTGGFVIHGQDASDNAGFSVASAGDINGDGFADLFIAAIGADAASNAKAYAGDSYVVFGKASGWGAAINLANIAAGTGGFVIHGQDANDKSGWSVASAGDINGDGFADLMIGAAYGDAAGNLKDRAGDSYVVFGKASGWGAAINLANIAAGTGGFVIHGQDIGDNAGRSLASAGDINGDGFADLIIGAFPGDSAGNAKDGAGDSYVVFGKASGWGAAIDLTNIAAGTGGFVIHGQDIGDLSGYSVASAGDVNGDGFADLIIGAAGGDGAGNAKSDAGGSYVVFGKPSGWGAAIDLTNIAAGTGGFVIHGQDANDRSGGFVASAGDINGDGFADLIIGARFADAAGNAKDNAGDSYVVFGKASGWGAAIDLTNIAAGTGGFVIHGQDASDNAGFSLASAGDINGDGFADLIIGARLGDGTSTGTGDNRGDSYVVFGKASGWGAPIDLATIAAGAGGFVIHGQDSRDESGGSVASAGDINGDGFADLIIGARFADAASNAKGGAGDNYVIFGRDFTNTVTHAGTASAERLTGTASANVMVAGLGNDTLDGLGGADALKGGAGDDRIQIADLAFLNIDGGSGTDTLALTGSGLTLNLASIGDTKLQDIEAIDLGAGGNTLRLTALEVLNLSDTSNTLRVTGGAGAGVDFADAGWLRGGTSGGFVTFTNGTATSLLAENVPTSLNDNLAGTAGNDSIDARAGNDSILGAAGNDTLSGGVGADTLGGGTGNDLFFVTDAADVVIELAGGGADTIIASVNMTMPDQVEAMHIASGVSGITITGGAGNDMLIGNELANTLNGGAGADTLGGGTGNDLFFVTDAGDVVIELAGGGADTIIASVNMTMPDQVEAMHIASGISGITITGGAGNDMLVGNGLANTFNGGAGDDVILAGNVTLADIYALFAT